MYKYVKKLAGKLFRILSKKAVIKAAREDPDFFEIWELSFKVFPELKDHFVGAELEEEAALRVRALICAETLFLTIVIDGLRKQGVPVGSYVDIGDSDGSVRILLQKSMDNFNLETLGINLQNAAVLRMKQKGLTAQCMDAMQLSNAGKRFDVVSVFETLEHLPNPIGFLESLQNIVKQRLVISVPLLVKSRVKLAYLESNWPNDKVPTIENIHIFELSPQDWEKIFLHTGWKIEMQKEFRHFPSRGLLNLVMTQSWRTLSFEGFWLVSLKKDDTFRRRYKIE